VAIPVVVPDLGGHVVGRAAAAAATPVDNPIPEGGPVVEMPVDFGRVAYLRREITAGGYDDNDLEDILRGVSKRGDSKTYDAPFKKILGWAMETVGLDSVTARTIRPSTLIQYLRHLRDAGASISVLKMARSAISATISVATDDDVRLGSNANVKRYIAGVQQLAPPGPKKLSVPSYHDVALLYSLCWLYGPNTSLSDGLLKEKAVTLLLTDGACRPSDVWNLNRVLQGRHLQLKFDQTGMDLRYWWPKEVVPGSGRSNSSNVWFSKWVRILRTKPTIICSVSTVEDLLSRTSDLSIFGTRHIKQLNTDVQPLVWGQLRQGFFKPASVDHVSNLVQQNIDLAQMGKMKTSHLRGASVSKIVDLVPELRHQAIALARWTTETTFVNHYYAPLLISPPPVPANMRSNPQQVLRWGWKAKPPAGVSVSEYEKGPDFWVGQTIRNVGKIHGFDEGIYKVGRGGTKELYHYELMDAISTARDIS
jgi:hypothetical protein